MFTGRLQSHSKKGRQEGFNKKCKFNKRICTLLKAGKELCMIYLMLVYINIGHRGISNGKKHSKFSDGCPGES